MVAEAKELGLELKEYLHLLEREVKQEAKERAVKEESLKHYKES